MTLEKSESNDLRKGIAEDVCASAIRLLEHNSKGRGMAGYKLRSQTETRS